MKTIQVLAIVRNNVLATKESKEFGLLSIKPIVSKSEDKWEIDESITKIAISLFDEKKYSNMLRVNNAVIIVLEYHEDGVTSYTKDDVEKFHTSTGWYVQEIQQVLYVDIDEIRYDVDIRKYLPSIFRGIELQASQSVSGFKSQMF